MKICLVAQDGCFGSAITSVVDIFQVAETVRVEVDPTIPALELDIAGRRRKTTTSSNMTLTNTCSLAELPDFDIVIVTALGTLSGPATHLAVTSSSGQAISRALMSVDVCRTRLAAACTGVFTLAESGHVDQRRATTSWFLGPEFCQRFPAVDLDLDSMVVVDGPIVTAGAAFAHIDLALTILHEVSVDLAQHVAKLLLIDERPSQAAFVAFNHLSHEDPLVIDFERYVRANLDKPLDVGATAAAIGTSRRTLERRIRAALNLTPLGFVQRLRLERARHLRATTNLSTEDIARRVGYANAETLRALLRRHR